MQTPPVKLLFVGDVMLGRVVNDILKVEPAEYIWGDTLPLFRSADWRACNLECAISDRGQMWSATPKAFFFRSDLKNVAVLKRADINCVSLANNHTLDYEFDALCDTLEILDHAHIAHAGAGKTRDEAIAPAVMQVRDLKIGFIALTDNQREWAATSSKAGTYFLPIGVAHPGTPKLLDEIRTLKGQNLMVVISCHWGSNWGYTPEKNQIHFARTLIEAGADIIFGHSPHVCRGIEFYHECPIIYSAGNFIDDYAVDEVERNDQSFIFVVNVDATLNKSIALTLFPTVIRNCRAQMATEREKSEMLLQMQFLCSALGTDARLEKPGILNIALL